MSESQSEEFEKIFRKLSASYQTSVRWEKEEYQRKREGLDERLDELRSVLQIQKINWNHEMQKLPEEAIVSKAILEGKILGSMEILDKVNGYFKVKES